jgi:hypothetical protein
MDGAVEQQGLQKQFKWQKANGKFQMVCNLAFQET